MSEHGRILAVDPGTKRIGLALSDELGITAQGLETIEAQGGQADIDGITAVARQHGAAEIVVGRPVRLDGSIGPAAESAGELATALQEQLKIPVHLWDERLTTAQAERTMLEAGLSRARRKSLRDRMAAQLILQNYLDAREARAGRT